MPATLGCVIATPTELPRVSTIHNGLTTHDLRVRTIHDGFPTYCHWVRTVHDVLWVKTSCGEPYNNTSWHAMGYYRSYPHDTSLAVFVVSSHNIHKPRN